jgi:HK97 gp10 family phage protein
MKASFKFEGGKELQAALKDLSQRVTRKVLLVALEDAAEPIRRRASVLAPRGDSSGVTLRDEIVVGPARGTDTREVAIAIGPSTRAFYGSFVELGTSQQPARPYLRPAFDEGAEKALVRLKDSIWEELAGRGISRPTTLGGGPVVGGTGGGGLI